MKPDSTRCFIAVELPEIIQTLLVEIQDVFRAKIRKATWTKQGNFHLTLKFLGEVENHRIPQIHSCLTKVALMYEPFSIEIGGMGTFPSNTRPRVLWMGLKQGTRQLTKLVNTINHKLHKFGFSKEKQFHPHLTLARLKEQVNIRTFYNLFNEYKTIDEAVIPVKHISLIKSELQSNGALYTNLKVYNLNKETADNGK